MRRVAYLPAASFDLEEIAERIAAQNLDAAIRFCQAIDSEELRLLQFPGIGTRRNFKNSPFPELRSWPIKGFQGYLIFYQPTSEGIEIVNILHGARDLEAYFENR